jgi:hypothetical protein
LRWVRTQPLAVAAVIATMAGGIGAATAVYAVAEAVVLRALPVREPGRLVWLWNARLFRHSISPIIAARTPCSRDWRRS